MKFDDSASPVEVLEELAKQHPGSSVWMEVGQTPGFTRLTLTMGDGHDLLTVREPGHLWPVTVNHYHGDATHRTDYDLCGPEHDPNRHRVSPEDLRHALTKAKAHEIPAVVNAHQAEVERQQQHTPIDTPQKLYDLCKALLDGSTPHSKGHTAAVKHRHARHKARHGRTVPAPAPVAAGVAPPA